MLSTRAEQAKPEEARHTPGPWEPLLGDDFFIVAYPDGVATIIADLDPPNRRTALEMDANARLIAAAPELLEALEHMVRIVEDHVSMGALGVVEGPDGQPGYPLLAEYLHHARAAISKAIGQ